MRVDVGVREGVKVGGWVPVGVSVGVRVCVGVRLGECVCVTVAVRVRVGVAVGCMQVRLHCMSTWGGPSSITGVVVLQT